MDPHSSGLNVTGWSLLQNLNDQSVYAFITPINDIIPGTKDSYLDILRTGAVWVHYEPKVRDLILRTMRWDKVLRSLTTDLVQANAEVLNGARIHLLNRAGEPIQLACAALGERRQHGLPIDRLSLATWNNFRRSRYPVNVTFS
jgi:hypothetical protein